MLKHKIGLGTIQFGLDYGISNQDGKTPANEVTKILKYARNKGIDTIDTASSYGDSEKVLGDSELNGFKIVSKFMPPDGGLTIQEQLRNSLSFLKTKSLYGYLSHRPHSVVKNPIQWDELQKIKNAGLIHKIGFSFNQPSEVEQVLAKNMIPDLIQVPFNYFDKRFYPYMEQLKSMDCEIHTRSTFLQGLFFKPIVQLSSFFNNVKPLIEGLQKYGIQLPGLLLNYCLQTDVIDKVIIGVENKQQLFQNIGSIEKSEQLPSFDIEVPHDILTPSKWVI